MRRDEQRSSNRPRLGGGRPKRQPNRKSGEDTRDSKPVKTDEACNTCGKIGYYARNCRQKSYGNIGRESSEPFVRPGRINGHQAERIYLDTGSAGQPTICATGVQYWVLGVNAEHYWDTEIPSGTGQDRG